MGLFDITVYGSIALIYNLFIHQLTSTVYKNYSYDEKMSYSVYTILIAGIIALVLSKIMAKNKKYTESVVAMGLGLGGSLLIFTSILVKWEGVTDGVKVALTGLAFVTIIYLCYKYIDKKRINETYKLTDEEINDILD